MTQKQKILLSATLYLLAGGTAGYTAIAGLLGKPEHMLLSGLSTFGLLLAALAVLAWYFETQKREQAAAARGAPPIEGGTTS